MKIKKAERLYYHIKSKMEDWIKCDRWKDEKLVISNDGTLNCLKEALKLAEKERENLKYDYELGILTEEKLNDGLFLHNKIIYSIEQSIEKEKEFKEKFFKL